MTTTTDLAPGINIGAVRHNAKGLWVYRVTEQGDNLRVQQDVGTLPADYDVTGYAHVTFISSYTRTGGERPAPLYLTVPARGAVEVKATSDDNLRVTLLTEDGEAIAHIDTKGEHYVVLNHRNIDGDALRAWYADGASDTY